MIAQELEVSLHMAFVEARQQRHEFITVEHLLLALLDNPSAAEVLRACSANIDDLRKSLSNFIKDNTPAGRRHRRRRHPADAGFPARDPARHHACAVHRQRQEGSHRRQRAGRDLRREGFARGLLPAPAGRDAPGRGELHRPRHQEERSARARQGRRIVFQRERRGRREEREGFAAGAVHAEPEPGGQGRQDRSADRPRVRGRARDPDPVPPPQEQPAAGRRGRRGQDRDRRRPGLAHRAEGSARDPGRLQRVFAGHGRAAGRHQVPRRLRAAPEGRAQVAQGQAQRDPVHRRDPHADRRRRGIGRHAGRVQPAQAGALELGRAQVHRRDDVHRVPRHLREGRGPVAALPEGRRGRAERGRRRSRS